MTLSETSGLADHNVEVQPETSEFSASASEMLENGQSAEQCIKRAQELLAEGRRHLVCRSYQEAVDALDDACKLFCRQYGDMAFECADAYFYYGKSLIELERINQNIVNVKDNNAEKEEEMSDEEDEQEEECSENVADSNEVVVDQDNNADLPVTKASGEDVREKKSTTENAEESNTAQSDQLSNANGEVVDQHVETNGTDNAEMVENKDLSVNEDSSSVPVEEPCHAVPTEKIDDMVHPTPDIVADLVEQEVAGCSSDVVANNEKSEQEPEKDANINIAWEMLDLARVIYEKKNSENEGESSVEENKTKYALRLSEVRMALGEVCALNERYGEAVQEFLAAHELLKPVCSDDDRRLAEIFFQIGSVSELDEKYDEAARNIEKASTVLAMRKRNLQAKLDQPGESSEGDREEIRREVDELDLLLKDIDDRLADLIESQRNVELVKASLRKQLAQDEVRVEENLGEKTENATGEPQAVVTDVSHLVRKSLKRLSGDGRNDEQGVKKGKFDDISPLKAVSDAENGESKQNGLQHDVVTQEAAVVEEIPAENGLA